MSKSTDNKITSFFTATADFIANEQALHVASDTAYAQTSDIDDLRLSQKHLTKAQYTDSLASMSVAAREVLATMFTKAQLATMLNKDDSKAVVNNSYSLEKLRAMLEAVATNDATALVTQSKRSKVNTALFDYMREVKRSERDSKLSRYAKAVAHQTTTQADQTTLLLQRLDMITEKSKAHDIVLFNSDSKLLNALMNLDF